VVLVHSRDRRDTASPSLTELILVDLATGS